MSQFAPVAEVAAKIKDGMTVMVGGFLGNGTAEAVIDALVASGVKGLTVIVNDTAYPDRGVGKLINNKQVKKFITSYIGATPAALEQMNAGELEVEFVPQGTLIERIRCGGYGLGGVLVPTGMGTVIAAGKRQIEVQGRNYLLEEPLHADVAIIGATKADKKGNLWYAGTSRNFNPVMAAAADLVVAQAGKIVEIGDIEPENVHTPAQLVDFIVK